MERFDTKALGRNLRQARRRLGLTQAQVAERMEMTEEAYSRMERGHLVPRLERFVALCQVLRETPDQLVAGVDPLARAEAAPPLSSTAAEVLDVLKRTLGAHLLAARKRLGLTQVEMAERVQMPVTAYGRMERGAMLPRLDGFVTLLQVLDEVPERPPGLPRPRGSRCR